MNQTMSDWFFEGKPYTEGPSTLDEYYGFVYMITNNLTSKKYIGCKFFWMPKYKMVNKKRKKFFVHSDWKDYWSSSVAVNEQVESIGKDNFKREILHLVKYKGMVKYLETREIMDRRALENDEYLNGIVGCKIHRRCVRF